MLLSHHQNASQNRDIKRGNIILNCVTVETFVNDSNKLNSDSGGN
jgi:hypothetical protein